MTTLNDTRVHLQTEMRSGSVEPRVTYHRLAVDPDRAPGPKSLTLAQGYERAGLLYPAGASGWRRDLGFVPARSCWMWAVVVERILRRRGLTSGRSGRIIGIERAPALVAT